MRSIAQYQETLIPVLKKYGVQRASIFGSVAKGVATLNSDIDILIEPKAGFTLFNMMALEADIEDLLNIKVDLVEFNAIKSSIKSEVLTNAVVIL